MNKYYTRIDQGGYNPCIYGNNKNIPIDQNRNVLPNCVGYCVGRFNELIGQNNCNYLGNTNANNMINLAKTQGLSINSVPKVGACIVWDDGNCGHCAIVEQVISANEIIISESGWNAKSYVWNARHYSSNNWCDGDDKSWMGTKYKFLGFIYNPIYDIVNPEEENKNIDQLKILFDDTMYVRDNPNGNKLGLAKSGYYTILEIKEDSNYKWVRIGKYNWVAELEPYSRIVFKALEEQNNENSINILEGTETSLEVPKNEYRYEIWTDKKKIELIKDTSLYNYETNESIKNYKQGSTIKNIIGICDTGETKYYITEYSFNNTKNTGFKIEECNLYEYEMIDIVPKIEKDTIINLIIKIINIIKKLFKVGE